MIHSHHIDRKTLLHVGAGYSPKSSLPSLFGGWTEVRVDIDPETSPDIIASMTQMPGVDAASVDAAADLRVEGASRGEPDVL